MAKCIRRVGIVFFAIFISCLLLVCCGLAYTLQQNNGNANLNQDRNIKDTASYQETPIAEEILLDGKTCSEQAEKWGKAIEKSLEGKHILVTLMADWIAQSDSTFTKSFGSGVGINDGRIYIPPTANITLDLNGYTISRGLTAARTRGQVIVIYKSSLTIKDSQFDIAKIRNAYNANPDSDLSVYGAGKITGGFDNGNGGAIYMEENCSFTLESGMLCNNSGKNGGAIQVYNNSRIIINNGLFCNNSATYSGGALFVQGNSSIIINGGIFHKNTSGSNGGAVNVLSNCEANINSGVFSYNKTTTSTGEGGAIFFDYSNVNITGGVFEYNHSVHCGGGIRIGGDCSGVLVSGVYIHDNSAETYAGGLRLANNLTCESIVKDCVIVNNSADSYGGGATFEHDTKIGAGVKIYNNITKGKVNNLVVRQAIKIEENLMKDGKNTYIGITNAANSAFTSGYTSSGNTIAPTRFFFSDTTGLVAAKSSNEVILKTGTKPTAKLNWSWGTGSDEKTTDSNVFLPYKEGGYNISIGGGSFYKNTSDSNTISGTSFTISEPGDYAFYADGNYLNPTFNVKIEKPKTQIVKPVDKSYIFVCDGSVQVNFVPENFDASTMDIKYNRQALPGKYTAVVKLKDNYNTSWADGSITNLSYKFEVVHPGVLLTDNSEYEYIYQDNNMRKNYISGDYFHKVNDSSIATIDGNIRYVMGGISTNTKLSVFLNNLRNDLKLIQVYDKNSHIIYDGIASNGVIPESVANILVGTGFKVELYENSTATTAFDTVYLSVLGDINGDGRITASDIAYLREIAKDNSILNTMFVEYQLAAMVNNKGGVTNIDSEILYNVMANEIELNIFFKSGVNTDSSYKYLTLNKENGKYERVVSDTATNVIGNVAVNTKVSEFKANLAILGVNTAGLTIYKNEQVLDDNAIVGTGCYFEIAGVKTYISVLGDLNGDGRISASDIMYARELIKGDKQAVQDCVLLSALILNTGNITSADSIVLEVVLEYSINISNY